MEQTPDPREHPVLVGFSIVTQPFWDTPILGNPPFLCTQPGTGTPILRQAKHATSLQTASEEAARVGETLQQWQAECAEAGLGGRLHGKMEGSSAGKRGFELGKLE